MVPRKVTFCEGDFQLLKTRKTRGCSGKSALLVISPHKACCKCSIVYRDPISRKVVVFAIFSDTGRIAYRNPYKRPPDEISFELDVCNFCKERGKSLSAATQRKLRALALGGVRKAFPLKKKQNKPKRTALDKRYKPHITLAAIDFINRDTRIPPKMFWEDLCQRRCLGYRELQDEKNRGPKRRSFRKSVMKSIESATAQAATEGKVRKEKIVAILRSKLKRAKGYQG